MKRQVSGPEKHKATSTPTPTTPLLNHGRPSIQDDHSGGTVEEHKEHYAHGYSSSGPDLPETIKGVLLVPTNPLYSQYNIYDSGAQFLKQSVENFNGIPVTIGSERPTPTSFSFRCGRGHYGQIPKGQFGVLTTDGRDSVLVRPGYHWVGNNQTLTPQSFPKDAPPKDRYQQAGDYHFILTPGSVESPLYTAATIADKLGQPHSVLLPPGLTVVLSSQVTLHEVQNPSDKIMKVGSNIWLLNVPTDKFAFALNVPGRKAPYVIEGPAYYKIQSPASLFENTLTEKDEMKQPVALSIFTTNPKISREIDVETKDGIKCFCKFTGQYVIKNPSAIKSGLNKLLGLREKDTPYNEEVFSTPEEKIYAVIAAEVKKLDYNQLDQIHTKNPEMLITINKALEALLPLEVSLLNFEISTPKNDKLQKHKNEAAEKISACQTEEQAAQQIAHSEVNKLSMQDTVIAARAKNQKAEAEAAKNAQIDQFEREVAIAQKSAAAEKLKNSHFVDAEKARLKQEIDELEPLRAQLAEKEAKTATSYGQVAKLLLAKKAFDGNTKEAAAYVLEEARIDRPVQPAVYHFGSSGSTMTIGDASLLASQSIWGGTPPAVAPAPASPPAVPSSVLTPLVSRR